MIGARSPLRPSTHSHPVASLTSITKPNQTVFSILSFCPYYPPHVGGLEKYADDLHRLFVSHGHSVTVFTAHLPHIPLPASSTPHLNIVRYPAIDIIFGYPVPKLWSPIFWRQWRELSHCQHDIVLSSTRFFLSSLLAWAFAARRQLPWLHIEHGSDYVKSDHALVSSLARLYDETLGRLVLRASTCNISPSLSARQFIARFDQRYSPLIYRGVRPTDLDRIPPATDLLINSHQPIIVFAGRLIASKGITDLLTACSSLPKLPYRLVIIGSGPKQATLSRLAVKLHLASHIIWRGPLSHRDTLSVFKAAAIVVNPSYNEGLPTVLLEAGLAGCALVATNVGGTSEIIRHNYSGLLYQPADITTLAAHLSALLQDQSLRTYLAANARQAIVHRFNWPDAYRRYLRLFQHYARHHSPAV